MNVLVVLEKLLEALEVSDVNLDDNTLNVNYLNYDVILANVNREIILKSDSVDFFAST